MAREVQKVVCYVVEDGHLLVFTHDAVPMTEAGVQVPAGSIEPGETPEEAAVRELFEETGRRGRLVRRIGTQHYDLRPTRDEVAVRHYVHLSMDEADVTARWTAGETNPSHGGASVTWTCWWMPLVNAHVLAAGFGGLLGTMLEEDSTVLHLRPLQHRDAHALAGWGRDALFCRHAGWTATSPAALHDFWVRQVEDPPAGLVRLAVENADADLVGYVDFHGSNPGEKELGFVIGPSHRWGVGLGRRAAEAGLTYGFKELGLGCIWAEASAANTASVRILRSLGMQETGEGGPGVFLGEDSHYLHFRTKRDDWTGSRGQ